MAQDSKTDGYYPIRWKIADAVEDIFVLHRSKAIGVIALIGLAFILFGFLLLGWGGANSQTDTASPDSPNTSTEPIDDADDAEDGSNTSAPTTAAPQTTAPTTSSSAAPATTETTTAAPTTTIATSARAAATNQQLAATEAGRVVELSTTSIKLVGGLTSDSDADEVLDLVESFFPGIVVEDLQVVDPSFSDTETWKFRLSAPDLFAYNRDNLNATYLPLIDQLAEAAVLAGTWTIEVSGHTDASGPSPGNQRLSEGRAQSAAQRLVTQGVSAVQVTSIGRGEDEPVATNDTEEGKLANRRVEFLVTP